MITPQGQPPSDTLLSEGALALITTLFLIALVLAAAVAPLLNRYYRRRVLRLMGLNQVAPTSAGTASEDGAQSPGAAHGTPFAQNGADGLAELARQREHRVSRATFFAWLTFAGLAPLVAGLDPETGLEDRLIYFVMAALLALGPALTNLPEGWNWWLLSIGFTAQDTNGQVAGKALWQRILLGLGRIGAYLALWYRRLRGQALPIFLLLACWLVLFFGLYAYFEPRGGDAWLSRLGAAQEGSPIFTAGQLILPLFWVFFLWVAFGLLDGLAGLIRRGWVSELSLGCAVLLMLIAIVMVMTVEAEESHGFWLACTPLLWVAATLGVYALALGRMPGNATGPQLLVLRVFSKDTSKQNMLYELQARWRYLGPVHQIGGPDMVDLNVDPYEASMFLSNRLHELFLPMAPSLSQLQEHLQTAPDREGRYFINEVFCFNTAWRSTVRQLMHLSDAIVLDVRGLTAQREGTGYEIRLLAREALLDKVLAVADDTTDWAHVESLLRTDEGAEPKRLMRLNAGTEPHAQELFTELLQITGRQPSA